MAALATLSPASATPGTLAAAPQAQGISPTAEKISDQRNNPTQGESSLSSSPRQFATDLTSPILEEADESESDTPNEPITPVSGRQSQDFQNLQNHDTHHHHHHHHHLHHPRSLSSSADHPAANLAPLRGDNVAVVDKASLILGAAATSPRRPNPAPSEIIPTSDPAESIPLTQPPTNPDQPPASSSVASPSAHARKNSRNPLRRMSQAFRRSNSQLERPAIEPPEQTSTNTNTASTEFAISDGPPKPPQPNRRWSIRRDSTSLATTRSNSPPSPPLNINMLGSSDRAATTTTAMLPSPAHSHVDFGLVKKKVRSSTGLGGLGRKAAQFVTSGKPPQNQQSHNETKPPQRAQPHRRASSFDLKKAQAQVDHTQRAQNGDVEDLEELTRQPWGMPAVTGVGLKARRLSVSLPDDFTVDVADLLSEFEYYHKVLGRHGKHLGKGATSKVTLMQRKGCPGELYAVKEFRPKSTTEDKDEYEQKIKSEFSIAKSLHHPNIVETIRLCTDHGRWNHVMEYCSEGDLYSLVEKKYLLEESRKPDRLCLVKQLVQGINYLHSNGIAHRDIKLENLLITKDSKLKITDFGVSDVFCGIHPGLREAGGQCGIGMGDVRLCDPGICGSLPYISPEVLCKDSKYDPRALDVWGAGVVAINLFFGAPLWKEARDDGANPQYSQLVRAWDRWEKKHGNENLGEGEEGVPAIVDGDQPYTAAFDMGMKPPALRRLVFGMLHPNPRRRLSISDVLNNRWMKTVECCQFESYDEPTVKIDASKKSSLSNKRIFCHNHLPPVASGNHSLGKMPGQAGY